MGAGGILITTHDSHLRGGGAVTNITYFIQRVNVVFVAKTLPGDQIKLKKPGPSTAITTGEFLQVLLRCSAVITRDKFVQPTHKTKKKEYNQKQNWVGGKIGKIK